MPTRPNPYVGPRSFRTGETMYGRERETLELLDLQIAERIVLLYSPSGAGKTSLIQAALTPKLRDEGFNVLPPMRVSAEPPALPLPPGLKPERAANATHNRYVLSTLLSLEEKLPPEKRLPLTTLSRLTFDEYLKQRADLADNSPVLIFDQFEEILTVDATNIEAKIAFFEQIGEALRNRSRWALFSMREDYLAGLDPYVKPIPTRFATTYRLDLLGVNAAREAIQKPARTENVDFTDSAATKLVDDLRRIQVQRPDGTMETQPGLYVEPVQLQVVCFRLWDKLPETKKQIVESDIADVGDVNTALADYYAVSVKNIAAASGASERAIREWVDRQLITEQNIRGQVMMEPETSRGLANNAIRLLENAHLVRADERRGATWFELAHDRLIEPVRASNAAWFRENLSALQQQADLWQRQGRQDGLLLRERALVDAEKWAQQHSNELTPTEQAFLSECRQARLVKEKEEKQNRRIRFLAIGATALSVIALIGICGSLVAYYQLGVSLSETDQERARAVANEQEANTQKQIAVQQDRISKMTNAALAQLSVEPEVSLLLATDAFSTTRNVQTDDALRQAVVESRVRGTFQPNAGSVNAVTMSPDGKWYAAATGNGAVQIWNAADGKQLYTLQADNKPVWSVAFSPDGKTLFTGGVNPTVFAWDLGSCSGSTCSSRPFEGHTATVWSVALNSDGSVLATASDDNTTRLWDVASGRTIGVLSGQTSTINSVAFSPDDKYIATASADGTIRIWDWFNCAADTCPFQEIKGPSAFWGVAFSPDGTQIAAASEDQNAYEYDLESASVTNYLSGHSDVVYGVAYSPDGNYIVTASRDGTARLWDGFTGQPLGVLRGHERTVWSVAFSPDSQLVLTGSDDNTAKLWTARTGIELEVLRGHTNKVLDASYSGDGKRIITTSADITARVYDAATGQLVAPILGGHSYWVAGGALNRDGTRAATASFDNTARLWDLTTCDVSQESESECSSIEFTHDSSIHSIAYSPDDKFVVTASEDKTAKVWDANDAALKFTFSHDSAVNRAAFSPKNDLVVTASTDGTVRVWDLDSATATTPRQTLTGHQGAVNSAAFSPDGAWIVSAGDDRTVRVFEVATGQEKLSLQGHTGPVTSAVFSPDGKLIITASADKTIRLWDALSGALSGVVRGHTDKVQTVEASPDNRFILSASSDRTARIVLRDINALFELAKMRVTRALSCTEWQTILQETGYCPANSIAQNAPAYPTLAPITRVAVIPINIPLTTPETLENETATSEIIVTPIPQATATLAPTNPPVSGAETSTLAATATELAQPTPPPVTPTPNVAPNVYIARIVYVPLGAPNFQFKITFLNTTGASVTYPKWLVPFFEPGAKNSLGAPKGIEKTIPVGTSEQLTETWKVGVGQCSPFTAKPVSEDQEGRQTPFVLTNGQSATLDFQLCP